MRWCPHGYGDDAHTWQPRIPCSTTSKCRERVERPRAAYGTFAGGDIFGLGLEPFSTNAYLSVPSVRSLSTLNACAGAHWPSCRTRSPHARSRPAPGQMHARGRTQCATEGTEFTWRLPVAIGFDFNGYRDCSRYYFQYCRPAPPAICALSEQPDAGRAPQPERPLQMRAAAPAAGMAPAGTLAA